MVHFYFISCIVKIYNSNSKNMQHSTLLFWFFFFLVLKALGGEMPIKCLDLPEAQIDIKNQNKYQYTDSKKYLHRYGFFFYKINSYCNTFTFVAELHSPSDV